MATPQKSNPSVASLKIGSEDRVSGFGSGFSVDGSNLLQYTESGGGGGGGASETLESIYRGILFIDPGESWSPGAAGDYSAISFATGTTWSSSTDAGTVLQSLHNDLLANPATDVGDAGNGNLLGHVAIGAGGYEFDTQFEVLGRGFGMIGMGGHQGERNAPVEFRDGGGLGASDAFVRIDNVAATDAAAACKIHGVHLDGGGANAYGIFVNRADTFDFYNVSAEGWGSSEYSLRVQGSYNSSIDSCFLSQVRFDDYQESGGANPKNVNQIQFIDSFFFSENADMSCFWIVEGGNRFHGCQFRTGGSASLNAGVPAITAGLNGSGGVATIKRTRFTGCEFYGDGDPYFDVGDKMDFVGCIIGASGSGPAFENVSENRIIGCRIGGNHEFIRSTEDNSLNKAVIVGNIIKEMNSVGGTAAIDISSNLNNGEVLISDNLFLDGQGTYDISIGNNGLQDGIIAGNHTNLGISETFGTAVRGNVVPHIYENEGYNPVGYSRATPGLPAGTGAANEESNTHGQNATVSLSGGTTPYDPTIVESDGSTTHDISGSPAVVEVPHLGGIFFRTNVPGSWTWSWE